MSTACGSDDQLYGGNDDDIVNAGKGLDVVDGGAGTDDCSASSVLPDTITNCEP